MQWHTCEEQLKGLAIGIMDELLFYDAIPQKNKPELGFPLTRNPRFVHPASQRFVNKDPAMLRMNRTLTLSKKWVLGKTRLKVGPQNAGLLLLQGQLLLIQIFKCRQNSDTLEYKSNSIISLNEDLNADFLLKT